MSRSKSAAALALTVAAPFSAWAVPSTSIAVSGQVGTPTTFGLSGLQALPQTTRTETYKAAGAPVTDTFTGPTLWSVLNAAGGILTNPAVKNDVLQTYVIATGSDGYKSVISSGEIAPNFGHKADLVAIGDTGGTLPGSAGIARVTASGDVAGGRYVSNTASLQVGHGPTIAGIGGGLTTSFTVGGSVNTPLSFSLPGLQSFTPYTETVTYSAGGTPVTDTYTGALLWDILSSAGITTDPSIKNDILRQVVVATGNDGYSVDFAAGELSPSFGNEPILVAYSDTAGQLGSGGTSGFARLVVPGDIAGGRYVSNLSSLTVFDATTVPEPASALLLTTGLLGCFIGRSRSHRPPVARCRGLAARFRAGSDQPASVAKSGCGLERGHHSAGIQKIEDRAASRRIHQPIRTKTAGECLCGEVPGPDEGVDRLPLPTGRLRNDMRCGAEAVQADRLAIFRHAERAPPDPTHQGHW